MKFTCSAHPELSVADLGVHFHAGTAEVTDKATIEALRNLPSGLGVVAAEAPASSSTPRSSKRSSSSDK